MDDIKEQPAYEIIRRVSDNWTGADEAWNAIMIMLANMVLNSNFHGKGPETWRRMG